MLPTERTTWAWRAATFFGAGYLRPGPGTYGSVAAVLLWLGAARLLHPSAVALALGTFAAAAAVTAIGIPAATIVAREAGREDPGFVVVDEVAGQLLALALTPAALAPAAVSLLLFRFFDILKPPPIRALERLPAGTGIMLDDLGAGVFALLTGLLLSYFVHR